MAAPASVGGIQRAYAAEMTLGETAQLLMPEGSGSFVGVVTNWAETAQCRVLLGNVAGKEPRTGDEASIASEPTYRNQELSIQAWTEGRGRFVEGWCGLWQVKDGCDEGMPATEG
ncbi:hypothetical protein IF1G_03200 [Cordyceps javanica]|uniref:Uncharacterized protein n=1 Tax=Cordyceps javanica TaxID=43265 RepID=A0A545V6W6_9HYPO|nr:hypothetical protein IF1G_03200 [Cordyceps javanica]TQW09358.1 hypothetical protein IF2G_03789 [Cordyceps javanica]